MLMYTWDEYEAQYYKFLVLPFCCRHCLMRLGALKSIGHDQSLYPDRPVCNSVEDQSLAVCKIKKNHEM